MNQHLHIVCADPPWPPDCSLSKDIFYTIESLYKIGKKIHLHYSCGYNQDHPNELNRFCESISRYRSNPNSDVFQKDNFPILMEGLRSLENILPVSQNERNVVVRIHDCNYAPPQNSNLLRHFFGKRRLVSQNQFPNSYTYVCMNIHDVDVFKKKFQLEKVEYVPAFISQKNICCCEGTGGYCLYHADLSLPENEKAVIWLLNKVFNDIEIPFIIAGKNPSERLNKMAHFYQHICLVKNPSTQELNDLVRKAQLIIIPSFDQTGPPSNLVESLFAGRHCITNESAVAHTMIEDLCHTANTSFQFKTLIKQLYTQPLGKNEINKRNVILSSNFNNERSAKQLSEYLW